MSIEPAIDYHRRRAEQERRRAEQCRSSATREAHVTLANFHYRSAVYEATLR